MHASLNCQTVSADVHSIDHQSIPKKMKAAAGPVLLEAGGEASSTRSTQRERVINRGLSIMDLVLRIIAAVGTLASAVAMGTTNQTLPFFTQFLQFTAQYNDIPTFT